MDVFKHFLVFLTVVFITNSVLCTEYVPVYMWSNKRTNEKVPALNKVSQATFQYDILERLKDDPFIVVFAEHTLSPEDFAQHDLFTHLAKLAKSSKVTYMPYVQNPIKALKHVDLKVAEVPLDGFDENFEIPETDILIVNLNDVTDSETRTEMLKRHDVAVSAIYKDITRTNKNVLAIYTSHHTSWVASEEVVSARQKRELLATDDEPAVLTESPGSGGATFFNGPNVYLYVNETDYIVKGLKVNGTPFKYESSLVNATTVQLIASSPELVVTMEFTNASSLGYWQLIEPVAAKYTNSGNVETLSLRSGASLYAGNSFSYHCGDQTFSNGNFTLNMKDFQIQVFFDKATNRSQKFGDAYDCVGFTSVPIWSGLFVTAILLMIMTIGITMMMDIRTMDRFDDPKGKTITVNAE